MLSIVIVVNANLSVAGSVIAISACYYAAKGQCRATASSPNTTSPLILLSTCRFHRPFRGGGLVLISSTFFPNFPLLGSATYTCSQILGKGLVLQWMRRSPWVKSSALFPSARYVIWASFLSSIPSAMPLTHWLSPDHMFPRIVY